jgi:hypothetical protein
MFRRVKTSTLRTMSRIRSLLASLLVVCFVAGGCSMFGGGHKDDPSTGAQLASLQRLLTEPRAVTGTYVGQLGLAGDTYVAVVTDDRRVRVYVCDGKEQGYWFSGDLFGDSFDLTHPSGAHVAGAVRDGHVSGVYTGPDGALRTTFSASFADRDAGLFRGDLTTDKGRDLAGWIVANDGSQRGVVSHTNAGESAARTEPAPSIDPAAVRRRPTMEIPGTGFVPVIPINPTHLEDIAPTSATEAATFVDKPAVAEDDRGVVVKKVKQEKVDTLGAAPKLTAAFQPSVIAPGESTTYHLSIAATAAVRGGATGVGVPSSLRLDRDAPIDTTCAASVAPVAEVSASSGDPDVAISRLSLDAGASCEISFTVTAAEAQAVNVVTDEFTASGLAVGKPTTATVLVQEGGLSGPGKARVLTGPTKLVGVPAQIPPPPTFTPPPPSINPPPLSGGLTNLPLAFNVSTRLGVSPLPVAFSVTRPADFASWRLIFSDGSNPTSGTGALPTSIPKTFVNTSARSIVVSADLVGVLTNGSAFGPVRLLVTVEPETPPVPSLRIRAVPTTAALRGTTGSIDVTVTNEFGSAIPGPFLLLVDATGVTGDTVSGTGWTCNAVSNGQQCLNPNTVAVGASLAPLKLSIPFGAAAPSVSVVTATNLVAKVVTIVIPGGSVIPVPVTVVNASIDLPVDGFVASAGPDQKVASRTTDPTGALKATPVTLDASATSSAGRPQTYTWTQTSGPAVTITPASNARDATFLAPPVPASTPLTFQVAVTDGLFSSTDQVTVTVDKVNVAPEITFLKTSAAGTTAPTGEFTPNAGVNSVKVTATTTDGDGEAVTVTWKASPVPASVVLPATALVATGASATLSWPIAGARQVILQATAKDASGATAVKTFTVGAPITPLLLPITAPASVAGGAAFTVTVAPSIPSTIAWKVVAGPAIDGLAATATLKLTAPAISTTTQQLILQATATPNDGSQPASATAAILLTPGGQLAVQLAPTVDAASGSTVTLSPTITGPANPTIQWTQTLGPPVTLSSATIPKPTFTAPGGNGIVGFRLRVQAGGQTIEANTVVTIGIPAPATGPDCAAGSVLTRAYAGERVFSFGGHSTIDLGVLPLSGPCVIGSVVFTGSTINLASGFFTGTGLSGTLDGSKACFTAGTVKLPPKLQLGDVDLATTPGLCFVFANFGGPAPVGGPGQSRRLAASGGCDFPLTGTLNFPKFALFPVPDGLTPSTSITLDCSGVTLSSTATAVGTTQAVQLTATVTPQFELNASVTITNLPLLGGAASGTGTIHINGAGVSDYLVTGTITNPADLTFTGFAVNQIGFTVKPGGLTVTGKATVGTGTNQLVVKLDGSFTSLQEWSITLTADSTAPWTPRAGLVVQAANITGTVSRKAGAVTFRVAAGVQGTWTPAPGFDVTQVQIEVANTAVPTGCPGIAAGSVWVRVSGNGTITIPSVTGATVGVEACIGFGSTTAFSLRTVATAPSWQPSPGVSVQITDVGFSLTFDSTNTLKLSAQGSVQMQGLTLTARVLFFSGGTGPTVLAVEGTGNISSLGLGGAQGSLVFATGPIAAYPLTPTTNVAIAQGLNAILALDLGPAAATQLSNVLHMTVSPSVVVTASIGGPSVVLTAALTIGGSGLQLFASCPAPTASGCPVNDPSTTRLALTSVFIRMVFGGASGFQIGFGGTGSLHLPPGKAGGTASDLTLGIEAFLRPPAEVGMSLYFTGDLTNALGIDGLTLSKLAFQGSIDFTVPTAPVPSIGVLAEVTSLPADLANLLGVPPVNPQTGKRGETIRFALNIAPKAPIFELTVGDANSATFLRPLAAAAGTNNPTLANGLEVDFASVVFAPLGGSIGPFVYPAGVSARFGAKLLGVPVDVGATIDIAGLHINGTVKIGAFALGGVALDNTEITLDITPLRFAATIKGGVALGVGPRISAQFDLFAGVNNTTSGPTTTKAGATTTAPPPAVGIAVHARLEAANWDIGPGFSLEQVVLDGNAVLDALNASFTVTLNVSAKASVAGIKPVLSGEASFADGKLTEIHIRFAPGTLTFGPNDALSIGGDGKCIASLVTKPSSNLLLNAPLQAPSGVVQNPNISLQSLATSATTATTVAASTTTSPPNTVLVPSGNSSGPCIQFDYVDGATPPFIFGFRGTVTVAGIKTSVLARLDGEIAQFAGQTDLGSLGMLDTTGVLAMQQTDRIQIKDVNDDLQPAVGGDWRIDGTYSGLKALGPVSAKFSFAAGSVDLSPYARLRGDVTVGGGTLAHLSGTISKTSSGLVYDLNFTSSAKVDRTFIGLAGPIDFLMRPFVFGGSGARPSDDTSSTEQAADIVFAADYKVKARLTNTTGLTSGLAANAHVYVAYAEKFRPNGSSAAFNREAESKWNVLADLAISYDSNTGVFCYSYDPHVAGVSPFTAGC